MSKQTESNITCKNCETQFSGNFCPQCGQSIKDYDKPFGLIIYDLMGNIFAFDTRLWRTCKAILFQPGKMANEFIVGHRVRYMPPFRFYIFVSFIFFILLSQTTESSISQSDDKTIIAPVGTDNFKLSIDKDNKVNTDSIFGIKELDTDELSQTKETVTEDSKVEKKVKDVIKHPEHYLPQFYKYLSWILFLLMPLYGSLLWLFFRKSYRYYLGHLIFAINQHSFLFVIFIIYMILEMLIPKVGNFINNWLIFIVPVYSVIGAKRLYKKKWATAIMRLTSIFFIYLTFVLIGVILAGYIAFV